jgi:hypothetical protein
MEKTDEFLINISKSLDGRSFTLFVKYLNELRTDVLDNTTHTLNPDSFLIFMDKLGTLTHSKDLNNMIITKIG